MAEGRVPDQLDVDETEPCGTTSAVHAIKQLEYAISLQLIPSHILADLTDVLEADDSSAIRKEERRDRQHATHLLVNKLVPAIEADDSHFETFVEALEDADFHHLADVVKHARGVPATSRFFALMGKHLKTFIEFVFSDANKAQASVVEDLVGSLQGSELLEEGDADTVKKDVEEYSPHAALLYLAFCVCKGGEDWPRPFLDVLKEIGPVDFLKQLAEDIEPDYFSDSESEEEEEYRTPVDDQLNQLLKLLRNILATMLFPGQIMCYLPDIFSIARQKEIMRLERKGKLEKSAHTFIDDVIASKEPGKWAMLKTALVEAEFPRIVEVLEIGTPDFRDADEEASGPTARSPVDSFFTDEDYGKILSIFLPALRDQLDPLPIAEDLRDEKVITPYDAEAVMAGETPGDSVVELILRVVRNRNEGWFEALLRAIAKQGHWRLVEEVGDVKLYDRLRAELDGKRSSSSGPEITVVTNEKPEASLEAGVGDILPSDLLKTSSPEIPRDLARDAIQRCGSPPPSANEGSTSGNHLDGTPEKKSPQKNLAANISIEEDPPSPPHGAEAAPPPMPPAQNALGDASGGDKRLEQLELRAYQEELARPALEGKNVIICAPTGSGKTHVATAISKSHLEGGEDRKIAFLVDKVALVEQQAKLFRRYIGERFKFSLISGQSAANRSVPLGELLGSNDVFFMTAQILVDGLVDGSVASVGVFTLIIMDECHHADKGHPYNRIMGKYLDEKTAEDRRRSPALPQVVGLTASLGTGKAKTLEKAMQHVVKLCANMDAHRLCTVVDSREELDQHVSKPDESIQKVQGRQNDFFTEMLDGLMEKVEEMMRAAPELASLKKAEAEMVKQSLRAPANRGNVQYTQWHSSLYKTVVRIYDSRCRRKFVACIHYLKAYNEALIINEDCRTKDSLDYVKNAFKEFNENYFDETDETLHAMWEEIVGDLKRYALAGRNKNPKLEALRRLILQAYREKPDSRGILFCKTRALTVALQAWMLETEELKSLNPERLVGVNAPGDKAGMTQNAQGDILKYFQDGRHKLIIATTVAEEGIDIQKCNLVIRYDHVTNEIALVQARGRGRAEDSKFIVLAQEGKGVAEKEELNHIRENLMNKAIKEVMKIPERQFRQNIEQQQRMAKVERQLGEQAASSQTRLAEPVHYHFRCLKCDEFALYATDVRKVENSHHVVINQDFKKLYREVALPQPQMFGEGSFGMTGKIYCRECNSEWGGTCIYKKDSFPVIKISQFVAVDPTDNRKTFKKWKQVPFSVESLTASDLEKRVFTQPQGASRNHGSSESD